MQNKIIYPKKKESKPKKQLSKDKSKKIHEDENKNNNHEYGNENEISNENKSQKETKNQKYPKQNKTKFKLHNICVYPKTDGFENNEKNSKKKNPSKKEKKINKSKINSILEKINEIEINEVKEEKIEEIMCKENPIQEYEEEIMKDLFEGETKNRPNYSIFPTATSKDGDFILSYLKRFSFINLFISFQNALYLKQETLYLCINLFDRYIQIINKEKKLNEDMNKIALTCLFIASKNEEIYPPYLKEFFDIFKNKYTRREIFLKEDEILSSLDFQVLTTSPLLFLKIFCQYNFKYENTYVFKYENDLCFFGAQFLLELCIIEPKFCQLKPSLQAAICLYLARKYFVCKSKRINKIWTCDLLLKTDYSETKIKEKLKIALNTIKKFFGNAFTKNFMSIPLYIKYSTIEYAEVSEKLKQMIIGK